ncbi:hypothetical protein BDR07DRAFT_1309805, partial [Suillus spraguei]
AESSTIWFTIIHKETGQFMGHHSIKVTEPVKNRNRLLRISMLPKFWGKGYGTEVVRFTVNRSLRALRDQCVSLNVLEGNAAAIIV